MMAPASKYGTGAHLDDVACPQLELEWVATLHGAIKHLPVGGHALRAEDKMGVHCCGLECARGMLSGVGNE